MLKPPILTTNRMMKNFSVHPGEIIASVWRHRGLTYLMVQREVAGRYRGSLLGMAWSLFNPVLMLAVYSFVFSVVFKARWQYGDDSASGFALVLFAGMVVFGILAECLQRAPQLILHNGNFVKKVVFPLEIMPWTVLGSALFHATISLVVLLAFSLILGRAIPATAFYLPLVLLPLILLTLGLGWFLCALGVYLRDVGQTVNLLVSALMFLSPVFYPLNALPEPIRPLAAINPLAFAIETTRDTLIWGRAPNMAALAAQLAAALLIAWLGFAWFQKTRKGFGDVL